MQSVEHWATGMFLPDDSAAMQQAKRQWVRLIQSDAYLAGWRAGVEAAAGVCDRGAEQWYKAKNYDHHELVGTALHVAGGDIRQLPPPGCGKGGEG